MDIKEIVAEGNDPVWVIGRLKEKSIRVPAWATLDKAYDPKKHPVMDKKLYPDKVTKKGVQKVTRITLSLPKLAAKRMSGLMFGLPVKRIYKTQSDEEKRAANIIEAIFAKNRIDSVNRERGKQLFASCEVATIWYSQEQDTTYSGEPSRLKLRCKSYCPMNGDAIYPLYDEYDDMIALSIEYQRREGDRDVTYFDTYTATEHIRWRTEGSSPEEEIRESIELAKIPGVYLYRPEPIWEGEAENVYEAEWTLSRNGNYIRKNARPNWVIFSDEKVKTGQEPTNDNEGRNVLRYPKDAKAGYVTWQQAIESIKYHVEEIKRNFFTNLQLPDMSMDNMKSTPMSGEARKMLFIDAQMKAEDESGPWLEFFDREVNVVKAFAKKMYPSLAGAIESLQVEVLISVYQIRDETERINNLTNATNGKPIASQRTAIQRLGWVDDVDAEIAQLESESTVSLFDEPTV